jgi:hypothetical protein
MGKRRPQSKKRIPRVPSKRQPDGSANKYQASNHRQLRYASELSEGSQGSDAGRSGPVNDEEQGLLAKLLQVKAPTREELARKSKIMYLDI